MNKKEDNTMIYLTLPNFYWLNDTNHQLQDIIKRHPEYFKLEISIRAQSGNFPYCYWNGSINNNIGKGAYYDDINNFKNLIPLRINMSNIFLKEEDFNDIHANTILNLRDNCGDSISISDLKLAEHIKEKYPSYKLVFSSSAYLASELDIESYNEILTSDVFDIVEIPEFKLQDKEFIKELKCKRKVELPINCICAFQCPNYSVCIANDQLNQYNFSSANNCVNCLKRKSYQELAPNISIDEIKTTYKELGINNFRLADMIPSKFDDYVEFLINYFVKDEYKFLVNKLLRQQR